MEITSYKTFPVGTSSKILFLTSTTVVYIQEMSKIRRRMVKPKIIESLSACKNKLMKLVDLEIHT